MNHAITIGDVLYVTLPIVGVVVLGILVVVILVVILDLMNPWRSGH